MIVIYGSTGTGKSDVSHCHVSPASTAGCATADQKDIQLAVELATRFNGEVINADAMQMYKGLPVITNKLTTEEQRGVPHHLLGSIELSEDPWAVPHFKSEATRIIAEIRARGKLPIVVGGTSYYLDGLLFDGRIVQRNLSPAGATIARDELEAKFPILTDSAEAMLKKLREVDPVMADRWHPNNTRKIRTSLEIYFATGRPASEIYAEQRGSNESRWALQPTSQAHSLGQPLLFWLYARREVLNERLDKRVDKMLQNGLVDETAEAYDYLQRRLAAGETVDRTKGIWQSIGFRQFEPYLSAAKDTAADSGALAQLKEAGIERTKTVTRQYAKDQVRWMTLKTIASLQDEKLLDRLYLLDSSDLERWRGEVLDKGVELARQFLAGEQLPSPSDLSETAREVLASSVERCNQEDTPCRKTCDVCKKTILTEELWKRHITGKKHKNAVRGAKRRMLIPAHLIASRALVTVQPDSTSDTGPEIDT